MNEPPNPEVAVFAAALELPAQQRSAYLDQACAGDAALRRQVEALLRVHDEAGNFFDKLSSVARPTSAEGPLLGSSGTNPIPGIPAEKPGDRIGRYKLLQQIGEGGCGVVYMAEQEEPVRRRVALKVIKLGMDTKSVIARFEAERQALALMDHPNIAKVLEAGATETGRPYFVMELVRGIKITDYCDENNLSTVARLELFVLVCQAIQHAHQKGIIHRDIKPSNILVADHDGVPVPKIIDFGIAKATTDQRLTDKTVFTAFEQFIGTPAYMSPEQARLSGLDIDTRSDIYSLGVLLYELLTAKTPFDTNRLVEAGLDEIRRIIREEEPVRPSTKLQTLNAAEQTSVAKHRQCEPPKLFGIIRGDLDWIVMKALEKDRARRYETANGLAADVQRYLKDDAVVARPPSQLYRFQKLVRRNKLVFAAGSTVVAALVLGVIGTSIGFVRSRAAEREARENFKTARTALDDLLVVADQDLNDAPGMEPLRLRLWREAIDHYKPFLERPSADSAPRAELARLYVKSASAAEYIGADHKKVAVPAYESALAIQEQLVREHPEDRKLRANLAWTHVLSVWFAPQDARSQALTQAVSIFEGLAEETPNDPLARADLAWALYESSWSAGAQQRALSDRVLAIREQLVKEFPKSAEFRRDLADSLRHQGSLFQDDLPAALAKLSRSIDLDAALEEDLKQHADAIWLPARPSDSELFRPSLLWTKRDEAAGCMSAARVNGQLGKWTEALVLADRAVGIYRRLVEQNLTVTEFTTDLWSADEFCASAADRSEGAAGGQTRRVAAANFWVDLARESGQQPLRGSGYSITLGRGQREIAEMLRQKGQRQQAEQILRGTVDLFEKATQEYPANPFMRQEQAFSRRLRGDVLEQLGRVGEAESEYRAAIALYVGLKASVPTNSFYYQEEGYTTWMLAETLQRANLLDKAEVEYSQAIALHEKASADFPSEKIFTERLDTIKVLFAEMLSKLGRSPEARSMYQEAAERGSASAQNELAWFFATSAEPNLRDGTNAVAFGEKAVAATQRKNISYLETLAAAYAETGQFAKAISVQREAIALSQSDDEKKGLAARLKLYENNSPYRDDGAVAMLAHARLSEGKFTEAEGLARECLTVRQIQIPDDWRTFNARSMLGGSLLGQKKYAEAESFLLSGYEGMKQREGDIPPEGKMRLSEALQRLAQLYQASNRPEEAARRYREWEDITVKRNWEEHLLELPPDLILELVEAGFKQRAAKICVAMLDSASTNAGWFNNASWYLATATNPTNRDPILAVELANRAVKINPNGDWNTVGVAYYRAGEFKQAIAFLEKSAQQGSGEVSSFNRFFQAMAEHQVGHADAARDYYTKAIHWMNAHEPQNAELLRFLAETESLLGSEVKAGAENQSPVPPAAK